MTSFDSLYDDILRNVFKELPETQVAQMRVLNRDCNRVGQTVHTEFQDAMAGKKNDFVNTRLFDRRMDTPEDTAYWARVFASNKTNDTLKYAIKTELLRKKQHIQTQQTLTHEQERIVNLTPRGNVILVQAYAGTGKTTTLEHYARKWTQKTLYLAYNKVLADESTERFRSLPHVTVTTIHALAKKMYEQTHGEIHVGNVGLKELINDSMTIDQARRALTDFEMFCASDRHDTPGPIFSRPKVPHDAYLKLFQMSQPLLDEYDIIMLDEVQDCTDCILDIVLRQTHATRLFVGDVYQKIYGFRHVNNPFEYILSHTPTARCYYLSVAFRFGFDLMNFTNLFLLKKYNERKGFSKTLVSNTKMRVSTDFFPGLVVICRYNITALKLMFELVDVPVTIVGKSLNFEKEIRFAQDLWFLQHNFHDLIASPKVSQFGSLQELQDFHNATQNTKWKNRVHLVLQYGERTIDRWLDAQARSTSPPRGAVSIVTAHQSKGSEYDHVMVYDDFTGSSEDTHNTLYVAMTRAKKTICISPSLLRFFDKHTPRVRYPFDTQVSQRAAQCTVCRKRSTNLTVCTEDDPVSVLQGNECMVYSYTPICVECNK
jgi:hypothetical protein